MKVFSRLLLITLSAVFISVGLSQAARAQDGFGDYEVPSVFIDITDGNMQKHGLAVAPLEPISAGGSVDEYATKIPERIAKNLERTALYDIKDPRTFLEQQKRAGLDESVPMDFIPWTRIGADYLIKGAMSRSGGKITLEMRLFDVTLGQQILGKRYSGSTKDANKMANQFTNAVLAQLDPARGPGAFGAKIVFVTGEKAGRSVMMTELGGEEVTSLAGAKNGPSTQPTLGPGDKTAWIHREGKKWQLLVDGKVVYTGEQVLSPAFTPSGGVVAALSGPNSTNICSFPGAKPVTSVSGIAVSPAYSPDGKMAYVSDESGRVGVHVGGSLVGGGKTTDPAWSPKGDMLAYVVSESDIVVNGVSLTGGQGTNMRPSFSPDGRLIIFASTRGGGSKLYSMAINGENPMPLLTEYGGSQYTPYCSPQLPE